MVGGNNIENTVRQLLNKLSHAMKPNTEKGTSKFDCFRPVNSTITYLIGLNLFLILPLLAFIPHLLPIYEVEIVVWLVENYGHILKNIFLISILIHLLEVGWAVFTMCFSLYVKVFTWPNAFDLSHWLKRRGPPNSSFISQWWLFSRYIRCSFVIVIK